MPEHTDLFQAILQQYGLVGLITMFLLMGPVFTLIKTRNMQAQTEQNAYAFLSEFARKEIQRAERLEERLNEAVVKHATLDKERLQLQETLNGVKQRLETVDRLQKQVQELTTRLDELELVLNVTE
jgi:DNA repair exonuclease SbcCD ATPase subunit